MSDSDDAKLPEGTHTDFRGVRTYGDYLRLDLILEAQSPLSDQHDEHLFIIIHQATELWMKLILHEMRAAIECIKADELRPAFKMLARISRIQTQLVQSWDVLSTMTPADYLTFRHLLNHGSGFQSHQYRSIEFMLGNKNAAMLELYEDRPAIQGQLEAVLKTPGLYDEAIRLLARRGFAIPDDVLDRDLTKKYTAQPSVHEAWLGVYRDTETHWDLYEFAEELVDLEDAFQQWRFRHVTTVERVIGSKRGTGGTEGVGYLRSVLDIRFFPELWELRTDL